MFRQSWKQRHSFKKPRSTFGLRVKVKRSNIMKDWFVSAWKFQLGVFCFHMIFFIPACMQSCVISCAIRSAHYVVVQHGYVYKSASSLHMPAADCNSLALFILLCALVHMFNRMFLLSYSALCNWKNLLKYCKVLLNIFSPLLCLLRNVDGLIFLFHRLI